MPVYIKKCQNVHEIFKNNFSIGLALAQKCLHQQGQEP